MKRAICFLILASLMLTASCGENQTGDETTTTENITETTAKEEEYSFAELDLGGDTFAILNSSDTYGFYYYLDHDEISGERLDDVIYERNRKLEDKYSFKLEIIEEPFYESSSKFRQTVMAGDDTYDAAFIWVDNLSPLISEGCLKDLHSIETINLDKSWWDQKSLETMRVGGDQAYFAFCNTSLVKFEGMQSVFMNLDKFDDLGLIAPYDEVENGTWTIDKLHELAARGANLNGDESFAWNKGGKAVYGIAGNEGSAFGLIYSCGNRFIDHDKSGEPYLAIDTERFYETAEKITKITFTEGEFIFLNQNTDPEDHYEMAFKNNRSLLMTGEIKAASKYRDANFSFGILPNPKLDEDQENYISVGGFAHATVIPVTAADAEKSGAILDGLAYLTETEIMPEFYNNTVSQKRLRDDRSVDMLKIISESEYLDPGEIFSWTHNMRIELYTKMIKDKDDSFASTIASYRASVNEAIKESIELFK